MAGTSGSESGEAAFQGVSRALVISRPNLGGGASKFTQMFVGRGIHFLVGCEAEGLCSLPGCQLEAYVSFLPLGLLHGRSQHSSWLPSEPTTVKEEIEQDASAHVLVT